MTTFKFPTLGIDDYTDIPLINDITVVSATHVNDLRQSITEIEKALIGITPLPYSNTNIVQDGYNIRFAIETFDAHIHALETQLGFYFDAYSSDGYSSRIDHLESTVQAHRVESYQTDADGYSVHGVLGNVVGTENFQSLLNKKVDSGVNQVGPKFVARSNLSDAGNNQIEVYSSLGQLSAWIDEAGDAYFAGDLIVEGGRVIKGVDVIQNSLFVDGYSILGNDSSTDYTTIRGPLTVYGTIVPATLSITNSGDIVAPGANMSLGDGTGILNEDFNLVNITGDAYVHGIFTAAGPVNLGDAVGSDPLTIKGSIIHTYGNINSSGELKVLGNQFKVEATGTTIATSQLSINSTAVNIPTGNVSATGANFSFGDPSSASTFYFGNTAYNNTFVVDAYAMIDDLIVTNDISVSSGQISAPSINASSLTINNGVSQDGYVWTATGNAGTATWKTPLKLRWHSIVTNGITATDSLGVTNVIPAGFIEATPDSEIFLNTAAGPFTVNLPANPQIGDRIRLLDHNGSWSPTNKAIVFPRSAGIVKTFASVDINTSLDTVAMPAHGLVSGQRGTLSSVVLPSTLPSGEFATFVYVIVVNSNTVKFANSLANALSSTAIDVTSTGAGPHNFTSGTIMGSAYLELDVPNAWVEIIFNGVSWRVITA